MNTTQRQRGVEQRQRIYAYLCEVAARGGPMPTNLELQTAADSGWEISKKLAIMREEGLLAVEYRPNGKGMQRRCVILANGDRTAWSKVPASKGGPDNRPITGKYPLLASRGMSDFTLYGHLAEAVRVCRRAGDVVHRNERRPTEILINGRPGDVKARAAWHARMAFNTKHRPLPAMSDDERKLYGKLRRNGVERDAALQAVK